MISIIQEQENLRPWHTLTPPTYIMLETKHNPSYGSGLLQPAMHPTAWYWHQEHWKGPKALTNHVEQLLDSPEQAQTTKAPNHNPAVSCQTPHDATRAFYTAWRDHTLYIAGRLNVAACWIMFLALLLIASSWSFWKQSFYCCCFPNVWAVHTHTQQIESLWGKKLLDPASTDAKLPLYASQILTCFLGRFNYKY